MFSDSNIDGISSIIKSYLAQFPFQSLPLLPKKNKQKKQTKNPPEKNSLYFQKWIFLDLILKNYYILSKESFSAQVCKIKKIHPIKISCTSGKGNSKNNYYISGNGSLEAETILISGSNLQSAINK